VSEELAIQLHRLYQDYYARRLEFDDYRYRRGLLLDSLVDDVAAFTSEDATLPRHAEFDDAATDVVDAKEPVEPRSATGIRWYHVLAVCVLVVIAVVFFVTRQIEEPTPEPVAVLPPAPVPEVDAEALQALEPEPEGDEETVRVPDVGEGLVEDFVARQDWREMSVLEFLDSWNRLPESDRIVAKGAVWFEPLADALAYQIAETRDFAADPASDERLKLLYEFSVQLGLVELVPSGWRPEAADINRGAESVAPEPGERVAADAVADTSVELPETAAPQAPPADPPTREPTPEPAAESDTTAAAADAGAAEAEADNPNACSAAQLQTRRRNCFDRLADGDNGPMMRVLPAGSYSMGSDERGDEQPVPNVTVAAPFALSVFEIKVAEFRRFCEATGFPCPENPWGDDEMPVVDVSWHQAVAYSEWLSAETGQTYRLPTEEEWEYAARAGTTTAYPYGNELLPAQARYSSITRYNSPLPATDRTTQRNEFELWHMVGNVREWVDADWTEAGATGMKVVRGGSYASEEDELRSAARQGLPANARDRMTGIRLLREL
jgi:formylglycine-generating enzyme required for sulfatase activity